MSNSVAARLLPAAVSICLLAALPCSAASGSEVMGYFGGASLSGGGGSHPAVGFAFGGNTSRNIQLFGQLDYVPTGSGDVSASLVDIGGGLQVRIRIPRTKVEPYVLGTIGLDHASATFRGNSSSDNAFFYGLGAGFRYFVGRNWGLRPDLRFHTYTGGRGHIIMYTVGVFYTF